MSAEQKPLLANVQPIDTGKQPPDTAPLSLAQKILAIQNSVGVVNKRGKFGSEMGGGNYLRIEDAVVAVNKLMSQHKLIFTGTLLRHLIVEHGFYSTRTPHEKGSKDGPIRSGYIASVIMEWTLEDTESGEKRSWCFPGDGYDGTDKAVYKAQTGSRKYAIINIFNLPIGNDVEEHGMFEPKESKAAQKNVAAQKIANAAGKGNKTAIDALSQIEPEKKIVIKRPEDLNGHYITAEGYIAIPQLDQFFEDTGCKRFKRKTDMVPYWRVPSEYESGLVKLCEKLGIEIEG